MSTRPIFEIEGYDSADGKWYPLFYYKGESTRRTVNSVLERLLRSSTDELELQGERVAEMDDFRLVERVETLQDAPKKARRMVEAPPPPKPAKTPKKSSGKKKAKGKKLKK